MNASLKSLVVAASVLVWAAGCATQTAEEQTASTSDELRKCADGETLKGIDVSKYQPNVNWTKVKASGRAFAFARISDGLNFPDAEFSKNWPAMKSVGLVRGSYQYFRAGQDPIKQAQLVIDKINASGGLKVGDLAPVLDFETVDGVSNATAVARAKVWLNKIESTFHVRPIVYTGNNLAQVTQNHFSDYELWVPNYGAVCPLMPMGWTNWALWQDSETGTVPGVSGNCDTNFFNGNLQKLMSLTLRPAAKEPIPTPPPTEPTEPTEPTPTEPEPPVVTRSDRPFGATMGSGE